MRTVLTAWPRAALAVIAGLLAAAAPLAAPASPAGAASRQPAAPAAAPASQDWPTYLQNVARTSATTDSTLTTTGAPNLAVDWTYQAGGPIATSASIVGTTAYLGAWDGYEYAINTTNGALIWKTYTGISTDPGCNPSTIGITSAAAVVNGVVYVGGGGPDFYALDASTGAVLWTVYTGDNSQTGAHYNWSSPLIVGNYAYIGIASNCDNPLVQGQLLQVGISGAQQGQIVNTYNFVPNGQVGGGVWTSPTYDAATGTIFLSTGTLADYTQTQSQAIVALNASNLGYESSWQLPFSASISDSDWSTTPTLTTDTAGDQLLSVANKNGILYTFNRNDLAAGPVWQHQIAIGGTCPTCGDGSIASGMFANGVLYYAGGHNVQNGHGAGGSLTAFDPGTGAVLWNRQTDQPILGTPAYVNGMISLVEGSTFEVVNAANGQLLYSYVLPSAVYGAVSVAYGQFYVGTISGALYAFGQGSVPATPPTDPNCPAGFTCQDIHNPAKGSEQTSGANLIVTAAGSAIKGTGDQFRFISQQVTGDSQTGAQIVSQAPQAGLTQQAGLMVRQTAAVTSPFYAILDYPNDPTPDLKVWYRPAWGKNPALLATYPAAMPVSVMIQRKGNLFSAGVSTDGTNYTLIPGSTADVDLPATTMQGVAVASGSSSSYGTATFSDINAGAAPSTVLAPPAPADPCPSGWSCTDLGNPAPPGDTTGSGGSLTLAGPGTGFGGSSDSAHYAYQAVSGNESISAQVTTTSGASGKAQDGLMMRASTSPTAPMYSVYLNPGGSATVKWRVSDGIAYNHTIPLTSVTSPAYLKIVRWQDSNASPPGTYFSTLTSADGSTWTPVLGSAVAIDMGSGSYLAGLAATSGTTGATTPATFTSINVAPVGSPPAPACPSGFTCGDIGGPGVPSGNQLYSDGNWTLQASGDIWSVYDEFRYAYQPFPAAGNPNGDGTVSAHVDSQSGGGPWMRSGVMIRSGTDPQAPYYGVFATPQHGVVVQWRGSQAAQTSQLVGPASPAPVWVEASRYTSGGVVYYSAYSSTDGVNWTYIPGSTVPLNLPGPLVAGLASDANSSTNLTVSTYDSFAQGPPLAPPNVCPGGWTCTDIGGALPPGTDSLAAGTWNETGGGGDIWGTADSFHFVYQALTADGTVTAHVTAQQNTSAWAKAGVMVRAKVDPGSPYYAVFVTPGNGIAVQWRATQGGSSGQMLTTGSAPAYLMVGRYTSGSQVYYTAYTSPDGSTWTAIPGSTQVLNLTGPLLAGLAITSHNQGTASAVTLDTVSVKATELPPPGTCPSAWTCADIGTVAPGPGSQSLSGGTWDVTGFGNDIWGTADSFHFAYQALAADGSMSAQIVSQTNTSAWAKGGLMIRATTGPGSPYYAIFATPGNGIAVQWRAALGGIQQPGDRRRHGAPLCGDQQDRHYVLRLHLLRRPQLDPGARLLGDAGQPQRIPAPGVRGHLAQHRPAQHRRAELGANLAVGSSKGVQMGKQTGHRTRLLAATTVAALATLSAPAALAAAPGQATAHPSTARASTARPTVARPRGRNTAAMAGPLAVSVGYAEDKEINTPDPAAFPVPWAGAPGTIFLGGTVPGQTACGTLTVCYDGGAIRLDNTGATPVAVSDVTVDIHSAISGGKLFNNLWGAFTVPPGESVILTANPPANNPGYDNFDTSGYPSNNCTPITIAPTVTITIGGVATTLADSTHVLDTGGIDAGYCPPKHNESIQWRPIGSAGNPDATLSLGPATVTEVTGTQVTETATLLDGDGSGLPNAIVNFAVTSGPDAGLTSAVPTSASGRAAFTYTGSGDGEDLVTASVTTVGGFAATPARVMWVNGSAAGWNSADIGNPALTGSQSFGSGSGTWTISGSGSGLSGSSDQVHFASQPVTGGGAAAQVTSQTASGPSARAGVMLRGSSDPGAPYYGAFVSPGGTVTVQDRSSQGGSTATVASIPGNGGVTYLWVRGNGASFTAYESADGYAWQPVPGSTVSLNLGASELAGLAVTSGDPAVLNTATMTGAALPAGPPAPAPPQACPAPWNCADIGSPAPAGSQSFDPNSGTWTISAGGADITGTSDQFRYLWQALPGDGSVIARVATQTDTSPGAKAGVMFRASSDPGAANYALVVSPAQGIKVQIRKTMGGNTAKLANPAGATPAYVKITRSGSTFTAYTSPDGVTWTLIPGSTATVNLGSALLAGLAVTSHSNGTLGTVTMDGVTVG